MNLTFIPKQEGEDAGRVKVGSSKKSLIAGRGINDSSKIYLEGQKIGNSQDTSTVEQGGVTCPTRHWGPLQSL